jgi:hypothetical protein
MQFTEALLVISINNNKYPYWILYPIGFSFYYNVLEVVFIWKIKIIDIIVMQDKNKDCINVSSHAKKEK